VVAVLVADRGGGRTRGRGAQLAAMVAVAGVRAVVADLTLGRGGGGPALVAELGVRAVVVVLEGAVPSSPRRWEGTPAVGVGRCGRAQACTCFPGENTRW
jgi:hypothetical protein